MIIFNKKTIHSNSDVSSQPPVKQNTSKKKSLLKSLNKENILFLKSLGFKVKKH